MNTLDRAMHVVLKAVYFVVSPPPSKEALKAREGADRVIEASINFTEKQNIIGDLLRDMPLRQRKKNND